MVNLCPVREMVGTAPLDLHIDVEVMASSHRHSKSLEKKRVESRLVDTHTKQSHRLEEGGRLLIGMPSNVTIFP